MLPYFYKVPFNVPAWYTKTFLQLGRCIISGKVIYGKERHELQSTLTSMFPGKTIYLLSNGRYALELALQGVGIKAGDEVILPSFCCSAVITVILRVGGIPVFSDSGQDLNVTAETIEASITKKTKAVVVPHMFGNPADIPGILQVCTSKGIRVIDDAAQALGVRIKGENAGSLGDVGLGSFGKGKICFGTGGGWLIVPKGNEWSFLEDIRWNDEGFFEKIQASLSTVMWRRWSKWTLPLWVIMSKYKSGESDSSEYVQARMANLDAAIALTLLENIEENIRFRQERAHLYQDLLRANGRIQLIPYQSGSVYLSQVARLRTSEPAEVDRILKILRDNGFAVCRSYTPLHIQPRFQQFRRRPLQTVDKTWPFLFELPCEPDVRIKDVRRICSLIVKAAEKVEG